MVLVPSYRAGSARFNGRKNSESTFLQCGTGLAFPTLNQASFRPADLAPEVRESQPEDPRANLAWGRRWS